MGRTVGGGALLLLALFMLLGFLRSSASAGAPASIVALLLVVGLPAVAGVLLLRGGGRRRGDRMAQLRQQTMEAEILRLAMQHDGRLTVVEVASALALPAETAKQTLDDMVTRELADLALTDGGLIVYTFDDARRVGEKHGARGLLE